MKKRFNARLLKALNTPTIVQILARTSEWPVRGYVIGLSEKFVLLHQLEADTLTLNGYLAMPLREIQDVPPDTSHGFLHRALEMKHLKPVRQPDILLLDFPGLLSSASAHFPMIALETAHRYADEYHVGRVAKIAEKHVSLREISASAQWQETQEYRFRDIISVAFGGGYEDALWRVSEHDRESRTTHE